MHKAGALAVSLLSIVVTACGSLSTSLQSSQRVGATLVLPARTDGSRDVVMNPAWVIRPGSGTALLSLGAEWSSRRPQQVVLVVRLSTVNYQPVTAATLQLGGEDIVLPALEQVVILSEFALPDPYSGLKLSEREFVISRTQLDQLMQAPTALLRVRAGTREFVGDLRARSSGNITAGMSLPDFVAAVRALDGGAAAAP